MSDINPTLKNPLWTEYEPEWQANLDFAEMRQSVLRAGTYLDRWGGEQREALTQYNLRKNWAAQFDHAPELIDIRMTELWREAPVRNYEDSPFESQIEAFLANVDGGGTDINSFMRRVTEGALVNGVDVLVDKDATLVEPVSAADENAQPFVSDFGPLQRYDWCTDHANKYLYVLYYLGADPCIDERTAAGEVERYVVYDREGWRVYTENFDTGETTMAEGTHQMGIVPVVQVYQGFSIHDDNDAIATSIMSKLSPLSQYMLDLSSQSQLDLFMTVAFYVATGIQADEMPKELGASYMVAFGDPQADFKPVNANVSHITEKRNWLSAMSLLMLRKGKVMGLNASETGNAQSGIQVALESSPLHSELAATAGMLERSEREIVRLAVSREQGRLIPFEELGYDVKYTKTFTLQSLQQLAEEGQKLSEIEGISQVPELMRAHLLKIASHLVTPGSDRHKEIVKQIEAFTGDMGGITEPLEDE